MGALIYFIAQAAPSAEGTIDIIQFGFIGAALIWFSLGKVHPESTVRDLKERLAAAEKRADMETADAKAVRDAVIKDVVPVMALAAQGSKEIADLSERLLAIVLRKEQG